MPGRVPLNVSLRIRPLLQSEQGQLPLSITAKDASNGIADPRGKLVQLYDAEKQHLSEFSFDNIFPASSTASDVFSTIGEPLVQHVLSGYNACCFAYGQTGSGKTHNMLGPAEQKGESKGLIPQCVESMFSSIKQMEGNGSKISVFISFIEIYQEHVRDLGKAVSRLHETEGLKRATSAGSRPSSGRPPRPASAATRRILEELAQESLDIAEDTDGSTSVRGLTYIEVPNAAEAATLLSCGTSLRATAATEQNDVSSRSHTVFTIAVINYGRNSGSSATSGPDAALAGRLHMVDLAGSEDLRRSGSGSEEQRLAEARSINSSLCTLGKVVMQLTSDTGSTSHVPFRDSKLTRILKDSLGGNCLTHLLACIHPTPGNCRECLSTLQFALRCANVKTSPTVNTVAPPSKSAGDSNSSALIAELTKEVSDLQRELDDTHAHYQKLLEECRPDQADLGPIERMGDAGAEAASAAGDQQVAGHGSTPDNSSTAQDKGPVSVDDAKPQAGEESGGAGGEGGPTRSNSMAKKPRSAMAGRASTSSQEQALQAQVRSLEAQLHKAQWKCNEATNQLRAVRDDHEQLLQYSSQQSGKAAAAQRRSAATIGKLNEQLQQISEDRRNESVAASEAAAEERSRLLAQVDTLTRHNTQLIKGIPEMFSKHRAESDIAVRKSRAKEGELRDWFDSTISEMQDTVARRVNYAEACTEQAKAEGTAEAQELQQQLKAATEQCTAVDQEWQKEAAVLWRYCDRLAALVDLIAAGGVAKPPKPPSTTLPRKSDFVAPLTSIVSAATSANCASTVRKVRDATDQDPGRMDAAGLKRTLRAVSAVESYLANSGRIDLGAWEAEQGLQADSYGAEDVGHSDVDATERVNQMVSHAARYPEEMQSARSDGAHGAACPGWKLALARAAAELEKTKSQCSTLQLQNEKLKDELVDRLPEAREHKKCLEQEEQDVARCVNLTQGAERCKTLLLKEQASHRETRSALQSAQRRLRGRHLDSHHAPPHTPEATLRPCSAPLSRPPNMFQYCPTIHAQTEHADHRTSSKRRSSTARGSPMASMPSAGEHLRNISAQAGQNNGFLKSPAGVYGTWGGLGSISTQKNGPGGPLYNRHACTVVEDLVSTSSATIRSHKAKLRAASARPYMRNG